MPFFRDVTYPLREVPSAPALPGLHFEEASGITFVVERQNDFFRREERFVVGARRQIRIDGGDDGLQPEISVLMQYFQEILFLAVIQCFKYAVMKNKPREGFPQVNPQYGKVKRNAEELQISVPQTGACSVSGGVENCWANS